VKIAVPPRYDPNRGQGDRFAPAGQYFARVDKMWLDKAPSGSPVARFSFTIIAPAQYDGFKARAYFILLEDDGTGMARFQNAMASVGLGGEDVFVEEASFRRVSRRIHGRAVNIVVEKWKGGRTSVTTVAPGVSV